MTVPCKGNVVLNLLNVVRDGRNILGWFGKISRRWEQAEGGTENRGAFVIIRDPHAVELAVVLQERGVHGDARGSYLRLCPDVLTTDAELVAAAEIHAAVRADRNI